MMPASFRSRLAAIAILAGAAAAASPAAAFYCYIPSSVPAPVALREKPDANAKVLAMMPGASMVREANGKSRHKEWVKVSWYPRDSDRKAKFTGWTVFEQIYGGECAD